jgi:hypothetical protein
MRSLWRCRRVPDWVIRVSYDAFGDLSTIFEFVFSRIRAVNPTKDHKAHQFDIAIYLGHGCVPTPGVHGAGARVVVLVLLADHHIPRTVALHDA